MDKQSLLEKIKEKVGLIAFKVFLWSIRRTENEYVDLIRKQP